MRGCTKARLPSWRVSTEKCDTPTRLHSRSTLKLKELICCIKGLCKKKGWVLRGCCTAAKNKNEDWKWKRLWMASPKCMCINSELPFPVLHLSSVHVIQKAFWHFSTSNNSAFFEGYMYILRTRLNLALIANLPYFLTFSSFLLEHMSKICIASCPLPPLLCDYILPLWEG